MEENRTDDCTEEFRRHWSAANTKEKFAILAQTGRFTITELCRDFGVSRKTGHKYLKRYGAGASEGVNGYNDVFLLIERYRRAFSALPEPFALAMSLWLGYSRVRGMGPLRAGRTKSLPLLVC